MFGSVSVAERKAAPLGIVSAGQITLQIPTDLSGAAASIQVTRDTGGQTLQSAVANLAVAATAPGLYSANQTGSGIGQFLIANSVVSASNVVRPGDVVTALLTGGGITNPAVAAGAAATGPVPFVAPVKITVGGLSASLQYAGLVPGLVGAGQINFTVPATAPVGNLPVVVTIGTASSQSVLLPVGLGKPAITGVSNNASGAAAISIGSWVSIYGANLSATTRLWQGADFVGNNLPTALDGVSVKVNGKPAAVEYISPTQINIQAPGDSATGPVAVEVTNGGGVATSTATLQTYAPGFYTFGNKYLGAVHLDGVYVAPAGYFGAALVTRPAAPGETLLVYGTGFGPTVPIVQPGQVFAGAAPLADLSQLRIAIGGAAAGVGFAGLVVAGEYQFNLTVPALPDGEHAVTASLAGVSAQSGLLLPVQR